MFLKFEFVFHACYFLYLLELGLFNVVKFKVSF